MGRRVSGLGTMQFPCKLQRQWGNEVKDGETDGGHIGAAFLEVGARVGLSRRVVRLQGALEGGCDH